MSVVVIAVWPTAAVFLFAVFGHHAAQGLCFGILFGLEFLVASDMPASAAIE